MTIKSDGGPAFPHRYEESYQIEGRVVNAGMTLRDWFAGQALAGMMANETTPFSADVAEVEPSQLAEAVYEIADAMLAEREREN